MNLFAKIGCRVYQTGFRLAIPVLPYREPEILGSIVEIPDILKNQGINRVLLVTDGFLRASGATAPLEELLGKYGLFCAVYDKTCANPTVRNVEEAYAMYCDQACGALIAFGGGSAMDCAKGVGARAAYPGKSLDQLKGLLKVLKRIPTLIAIPTTAGTGSETTLAAVITDGEKKHKYTMNSFTLIPRYAVLDPRATYTLPPSLTATTGMDALTHATEAYIGRSTTRETRALALEAVRLIFENIETAYHEPTNEAARRNMLLAAYKAGIAFSKSYVGYVHAVAHSLGGQYNVPHGLANSVLLPIVLEAYGASCQKKLHQLGIAAGVAAKGDSPQAGAEKYIAAIREKNRRMGISESISGIQKEDIPKMARHASREANPLYPVPKLMDARELEQFYDKVADWSAK